MNPLERLFEYSFSDYSKPLPEQDFSYVEKELTFDSWSKERIEELLNTRPLTLGYILAFQKKRPNPVLKTGDYVELNLPFRNDVKSGIYIESDTPAIIDHHGNVSRYAEMRVRFAFPNFSKVMKHCYNDPTHSRPSNSVFSHILPYYRGLAMNHNIDASVLSKIVLFNADAGKLLTDILHKDEEFYNHIGPGKSVDLIEAAKYLFNTDKPTNQQQYAVHKMLGFSNKFIMLPLFSGTNAVASWASIPESNRLQLEYLSEQLSKWKVLGAHDNSGNISNIEIPAEGDYSLAEFGKKFYLAHNYHFKIFLKEQAINKGSMSLTADFLKSIKESPVPDIEFDSVYDKFYIDCIKTSIASVSCFTNPMVILCNDIIKRSIHACEDVRDQNTSHILSQIDLPKWCMKYADMFVSSGIIPPDYDFRSEQMGWNPASCKLASLPGIHPDMKNIEIFERNIQDSFENEYLKSGKIEGPVKHGGLTYSYKEENEVNSRLDSEVASSAPLIEESSIPETSKEKSIELARNTLKAESLSVFDSDVKRSFDGCDSIREEFDLPVYVIDDLGANELDDGISIEGDWLHVHIADPTYYMTPGSDAALLAEYRGSSTYTLLEHYPMVPSSVSRTANLQKGPAMTISVKIAEDGSLTDIKIRPTFIRNVRILNYSEVNTVLDWSDTFGIASPGPPWLNSLFKKLGINKEAVDKVLPSKSLTEKDIKDMRHAQKLVKKHLRKRLNNGSFVLLESAGYLSIKEDKSYAGHHFVPGNRNPYKIKFSDRTLMPISPSVLLVAECMIIGNSAAAEYLYNNNIPAIYRGFKLEDNSPDSESFRFFKRIQDAKDPLTGCISSVDLNMSVISTVDYTPNPCEHIALGVNAYTRVTSPLRRFSDTVIHYNLKSHMLGERYVYEDKSLESLAYKFAGIDKQTRNMSLYSRYFWTIEYARRLDFYTSVGKLDQYLSSSENHLSAISSDLKDIVVKQDIEATNDGYLPYCLSSVNSPFEGRFVHDILITGSTPDSDLMYNGVLIGLSSLNVSVSSHRLLRKGDIIKCVLNDVNPNRIALTALSYEDFCRRKAIQR